MELAANKKDYLPIGYESATVAHKLYSKGEIPEDKEILQDLDQVLQSYDRYMAKCAR